MLYENKTKVECFGFEMEMWNFILRKKESIKTKEKYLT